MKKIILFLLIFILGSCSVSDYISVSEVERILENFCESSYSSCFYRRHYIPNTIKIMKLKDVLDKPNTISVEGIHVYTGRLGDDYPNAPFKAEITFKTLFIREVESIKFYKYSKADWEHVEDYWETVVVKPRYFVEYEIQK